MNNEEKLLRLKETEYQEIFGVKKVTFGKMLQILEDAYKKQCLKGGRPLRALSILDKIDLFANLSNKFIVLKVIYATNQIHS